MGIYIELMSGWLYVSKLCAEIDIMHDGIEAVYRAMSIDQDAHASAANTAELASWNHVVLTYLSYGLY